MHQHQISPLSRSDRATAASRLIVEPSGRAGQCNAGESVERLNAKARSVGGAVTDRHLAVNQVGCYSGPR